MYKWQLHETCWYMLLQLKFKNAEMCLHNAHMYLVFTAQTTTSVRTSCSGYTDWCSLVTLTGVNHRVTRTTV